MNQILSLMVDVLTADLFTKRLSLTLAGDDGMLKVEMRAIKFRKMIILYSAKLTKVDFFILNVVVIRFPFLDLYLGNQNHVFLKFVGAFTVPQGI